jgi:plasmid segregation protein ParM
LSSVQVEKAVMTGVLRVFGKDNDCSAIIDHEKEVLADQIIVATKRKMRDAADLEKVYFVGGGSLLLHKQLRDLFPHAEFVSDPQFSNARGMYKIAKYLLNR